MVSGGGGAELVCEEEAPAAIERGEQIAIDDAGGLQNLVDIQFDRAPARQPFLVSSRAGLSTIRDVRELPLRVRWAGL
jgi:hypothetical protein